MDPRISPPPPLDYSPPKIRPGISPQSLRVLELIVVFASVLASGFTLWAARFPVSQSGLFALGVLVWISVIVVWTPTILTLTIRAVLIVPTSLPTAKRLGLRTIPPLLLLATALLLHNHIPERIMFNSSQRALNAWAKATIARPTKPSPNALWKTTQVGNYTLSHVESLPTGGVQFFIVGSGFFRTTSGYAYSPNAPPPNTYADTYTPVGNGWYIRIYAAP